MEKAEAGAGRSPRASPKKRLSASEAAKETTTKPAATMRRRAHTRASVAYFCMEYGLDQSLALYSGGLGILAGDIVKTSVDLDLPLYAVGIFWDEGYTEQRVLDGKPVDMYPKTTRTDLAAVGVDISVTIRGKEVKLRAFRVKHYPKLYLLEPTDAAEQSSVTARLYQGGTEGRLAQEIILGVGGVRLFRALGIHIDIYHFNEGHAVFAGLELIRENMESKGVSFGEAWSRARAEIAFTTHTPVKAGNEEHSLDDLIKMSANLSLTKPQLQQIGDSPFNMTVAGLRLSYLTNGVSQLHGDTAQKMWKSVSGASKILAITNGVHGSSWQDEGIKLAHEQKGDIWKVHQALKQKLVDGIVKRHHVKLDPTKLIVGFARRSATYKRHNLIFKNLTQLTPLLEKGRLQLVFAGKAHPDDAQGKQVVEDLCSHEKTFPKSVVYLQNYDMDIGKLLTSGCDVWLNNPVKPQEASGTSGMKAAMNGVLNLSILDGWWPEACKHGVNGWKIGPDGDEERTDQEDADALTQTLLNEVIPTFYETPKKWVTMMHASVEVSKQFSAVRMVEEYYDKVYDMCPDVEDELFSEPNSKRQKVG